MIDQPPTPTRPALILGEVNDILDEIRVAMQDTVDRANLEELRSLEQILMRIEVRLRRAIAVARERRFRESIRRDRSYWDAVPRERMFMEIYHPDDESVEALAEFERYFFEEYRLQRDSESAIKKLEGVENFLDDDGKLFCSCGRFQRASESAIKKMHNFVDD